MRRDRSLARPLEAAQGAEEGLRFQVRAGHVLAEARGDDKGSLESFCFFPEPKTGVEWVQPATHKDEFCFPIEKATYIYIYMYIYILLIYARKSG